MTTVAGRLFPPIFCLYVLGLATSISLMEIGAVLLLLLVVARQRFEFPPLSLPLVIYASILVIGILFSESTFAEKRYDLGRLRFFLFFFVLYLAHQVVPINRWLRWLAVITALVGVYAFIQHFYPIDLFRTGENKVIRYAIPEAKIGPLVVGTFNHHLTFSNVYLFFSLLFLSVGIFSTPKRRVLIALSLLLLLDCFWTQSRVGWVAIPIALLVLCYPLSRKFFYIVVVAALLVGPAFYVTDQGFRERFRKTFIEKNDFYNLGPRFRLWRVQLEMIREHPWFGMGLNTNERRCRDYLDRLYPDIEYKFCGHAHSMWLNVWATSGTLGLAAFIWFWVLLFRLLIRQQKTFPRGSLFWAISRGLLVAFIGFQIQGLTENNFGDAEVLHNVIFFMALAVALPKLREA